MAQQRRSPQHNRLTRSSLSPPVPVRRKYALRRSPPSRVVKIRLSSSTSHASRASSTDLRPVLVTLHPNLRRLPSRLLLAKKDNVMRDAGPSRAGAIQVGAKRKRVANVNENVRTGGRPTRGSGRLKRLKSASGRPMEYTSDESEASSMEVDAPAQWSDSDQSDPEGSDEAEEDVDDDVDSTDDNLINSAQPRQLQRLRKDDLVRLYISAGLSDDAESLTKSEIIDSIIAARDDIAELPPSSPPGRGDGNSSDYSSDDGNIAGDEETDIGGSRYDSPSTTNLRRRVTINDLGKTRAKPMKGRSMSMGHLLYGSSDPSPPAMKQRGHTLNGTRSRALSSMSTPPATRLRSRKVSASTETTAPSSATSSVPPAPFNNKGSFNKGARKGKQVEFSQDNPIEIKIPSTRRSKEEKEKEKERARERELLHDEESDLTELEVLEEALNGSSSTIGEPSPRRLRSKDKAKRDSDGIPPLKSESGTHRGKTEAHERKQTEDQAEKRVTPMRKAKGKVLSMREDDEDDEDEELDIQEGEVEANEEDELGEEVEEDEVDELVSSASATPPPLRNRRTPLKKRLRPRRGVSTAPSDGDDEGGEDEEINVDYEEEAGGEGDIDGEGEESLNGDEAETEDPETITVEPRKLRNGKIVGEEDVDMEGENIEEEEGEEEEEEEGDGEADTRDEEESVDLEGADVDAEGETEEDEPMEEDVDLTVATAKTLVRLKRDDLVRLCETRDLDPIGTKPQLAEALLQWRDRQAHDFSSPSSSGTARPPSTVKRRHKRRASSSQGTSTPILLRPEHVHQDEPRTPPLREAEPELELDLESLGLEDREIPPEKLQKLEKIGSGGFKDVFIGKFKGRKIAISEFRGQLSAMDIKELKLLGGFDHPNIVRFLGVSIPENTRETPVMIVSELCSNGDLFDYVRNVNPPTLHKVLVMMLDIARGLEYLHMRKPSVIHRDCKSSNILITSRGVAKIADFGLAKVKQSTRSMVRSLVGTVNWQAPELWHAHPKYNHKVDVFSCAMVYWEALQWHIPNKKFPWEGMNEHAIYEIVGSKRQRPSLTGLRKQWCPDIVDLIERMWAQEHQERPTMSEVVEALEEMVTRR